MPCVFQHSFMKDTPSKKVIMNLIYEAKADVVETVEDLTEDEDLKEMKVSNSLVHWVVYLYSLVNVGLDCQYPPLIAVGLSVF